MVKFDKILGKMHDIGWKNILSTFLRDIPPYKRGRISKIVYSVFFLINSFLLYIKHHSLVWDNSFQFLLQLRLSELDSNLS